MKADIPDWTPERALRLIAELGDWLVENTASFELGYGPDDSRSAEIPLGSEIAYLFRAIAKGERIDVDVYRSPLFAVLTDALGEQGPAQLPPDHPVWRFIHLRSEDDLE